MQENPLMILENEYDLPQVLDLIAHLFASTIVLVALQHDPDFAGSRYATCYTIPIERYSIRISQHTLA